MLMLNACVVTVSLVFYLNIGHLNNPPDNHVRMGNVFAFNFVFKLYLLEDKQRFKFRGV